MIEIIMINHRMLLNKAKEAQQKAYAPYSKFHVGAALLAKNGSIYTGCNVENASYGAAICAERTAFVKAISEGQTSFEAIAIVASHNKHTYPCGICRQFMAEFGLDLKIITEDLTTTAKQTLAEFLPKAFTSFEPLQDTPAKQHSNAELL
ncbi:cytidine deaminase [Candidatus Babeliales bacterium]|nr:cytidine deaminase [Candidatus Babeliales bacterium]